MRKTAIIFAVALAVRLAHLLAMRRSPFFDVLLGDAAAYDTWGRQIAAGDLAGREVFYQAPLYAYFLGGVYAFKGSLLAVRICQAVLGAGACVFIAKAAERLFGAAAGWIAGSMLAFYAPAIFFDGLIQKSVLDVFLLSLMLVLLTATRRRAWHWLTIGAVIGALGLTRENALLFAPVVLAWTWRDAATARSARLSTSAALIAGLAIVLLPVGLRNMIVGGEFHLTTTQSGPNFYIGNHEGANGTYMPLRPGRGSPEYEQADAAELASRAIGRPLSPGEVSSYWTGLAAAYIRAHPADWVRLDARKLRLLLSRDEIVDTESQESHEDYSPLLRFVARIWHFGVLAPAACFGVWITWSRRRALSLLYALTGVYALSVLAFYVVARYRLPLVPFLIIFAAAAVAHGRTFLANQTAPTAIAAATGVAILAVWCNVGVVSADAMRAATYQNLGTTLDESGRLDDAAAAFEHALALEPAYPPALSSLGSVRRRQGRLDDAVASLERAVALRPDFEDARFNLANALADRGNWTAAIAHYQEILRRHPDAADAHANLAMALTSVGKSAEAIEHFRTTVAIAPESAKARYNLGHALLVNGDAREAIDELVRASEIDPADGIARDELANAHNDFGITFGSRGQFDEAIQEFQAALRINPELSAARANLEAAQNARQRAGPRPRRSR